jgi:hypothetical protein
MFQQFGWWVIVLEFSSFDLILTRAALSTAGREKSNFYQLCSLPGPRKNDQELASDGRRLLGIDR